MAKKVGGSMLAALFGTGTVAYFVTVFFIAPLLGFTSYAFNISTVLSGILSFQLPSLTFLVVWAAFYLGYFGVAFRGRRHR